MHRLLFRPFFILLFLCSTATAGDRIFTIYNNTQYTNVSDNEIPASRSNIVYQGAFPELRKGTLPDKAKFRAIVLKSVRYPGPVALDFESIYLRGSPADAKLHSEMLITLADWTREALPDKEIGFYGLLSTLDTRYLSYAKEVSKHTNAFFPSMYTFDDDRQAWLDRLNKYLDIAKAIDSSQPVYAYIWPQYHDKSRLAGKFIDENYWEFQLGKLSEHTAGAIIWSKKVLAIPDKSWVRGTRQFMLKSEKRD